MNYQSHEIISLGSNCAPGLALRKLNLKGETYPFDWIISNPVIIADVLENGYDKFLDFESKNLDENIIDFFHCLFKNSIQNFPKHQCKYNSYGQYFTHYIGETTTAIKQKFSRYFERFFSIIKNSEKLLFIKSTEEYIYHKKSRDSSDFYYEHLIKVSKLIQNLNPNLNFKILNIEINNTHQNTDFIDNVNLDFPLDLSDNCEYHDDIHYTFYRNSVKDIINKYVKN